MVEEGNYLVVYAPDTGIAQLLNFAILKAENLEQAKEKFRTAQNLVKEVSKDLIVKDISEIEADWFFFT